MHIRPLKINKMFLVLSFFSNRGGRPFLFFIFYFGKITVLTFSENMGGRPFLFFIFAPNDLFLSINNTISAIIAIIMIIVQSNATMTLSLGSKMGEAAV